MMRIASCQFVCIASLVGVIGCNSSSHPAAGPNPGATPDGGAPDGSELVCTPGTLPKSPLALFTRAQYDATVRDLLGDDSHPSASFPPENQVLGFNNNTESNVANPLLVSQFMDAAEGVAARAVAAHLDDLAPCPSGSDVGVCGQNFVQSFGKRAFRRPLMPDETNAFGALFSGMRATRGYSTAIELVLQAMLQSPQFLYRVDSPLAPTPQSGAVAIGPYELGSRLSYFLTGSMPDAELFAAADTGGLRSSEEVEAQARRLLDSPGARAVVLDFNRQWLGLGELVGLARNGPDGTTALKDIGLDYQASLEAFISHAYWDVGGIEALFLDPTIYVNQRLAGLFGVQGPATGFGAVNAPDSRSGLLTQPALMALYAHSNQTAPVQRGVFVRERLMCIPVSPPPPNFNPVPPDPDPNATTRERFAQHTASPACSVCHQKIDGIGFGLEGYDQLGRYRTQENGLPVDTSGNVMLTDDAELDGTFNGAGELAQRLSQSSRVRNCLATNWYRYAMGRLETEADLCSLKQAEQAFTDSGGAFKELLVAITTSDAFRYRPALPEEF